MISTGMPAELLSGSDTQLEYNMFLVIPYFLCLLTSLYKGIFWSRLFRYKNIDISIPSFTLSTSYPQTQQNVGFVLGWPRDDVIYGNW